MDGPLAEGHGGPDHVPAVGGTASRARCEERARQEHVRLQLRAGDVRRCCGLLLGAITGGRAAHDRFRDAARGSYATLAPDATALGQIYYYVLEPPPGMDLAELRSKQDFFIKYALQSVDGVAEVASIGGYVRQYQIEVDPDALRYHNIPLSKVIDAVKESNIDVGAKTVESSGMEFIVRGKGFIGSGKTEQETLQQIENTVVLTREGVPVRIRDLAEVQTGPAFRDGALDFNGQEAVGGVVVMRYRENPRDVIKRVEQKIASLEPELGGIKIRPVYDRTLLIDETVATLTQSIGQETLITIVVMVLFLLHVRASIVIAITLPMAVLMSFVGMKLFQVDANIMSLAGIAIAVGEMVDMGIIILENIYGALSDWEEAGSPGGTKRRLQIIHDSAAEVSAGRDDRREYDDRQLSARFLPDRPRLQVVRPAGLDQDVCPHREFDRGGGCRPHAMSHLLA